MNSRHDLRRRPRVWVARTPQLIAVTTPASSRPAPLAASRTPGATASLSSRAKTAQRASATGAATAKRRRWTASDAALVRVELSVSDTAGEPSPEMVPRAAGAAVSASLPQPAQRDVEARGEVIVRDAEGLHHRDAVRPHVEGRQVGVDPARRSRRRSAGRCTPRPAWTRRPWRTASSSRRRPWRRWRGPSRRRRPGSRPGAPVCQLARSPSPETWKAPSTQTSRWPPRIIANESAWWKYDAPGSSVTGILPALIRSGSISSPAAAGPMPSMPFSVCRTTPASGGRWSATRVGWPMPRLTYDAVGDVAGDHAGDLVPAERSAVGVLDQLALAWSCGCAFVAAVDVDRPGRRRCRA